MIHTLFLYKEEYQDNVQDTFSLLSLFSEDKALSLQKALEDKEKLLSFFIEEMPSSSVDSFLQTRAKAFSIPLLFLVEKQEAAWIVTQASQVQKIGKNYTFFFQNGGENFFLTTKTGGILGKKIGEGRYIGAFFPFSWFLEQLSLKKLHPGFEIVFLSSKEEALFSTFAPLQGLLFQKRGEASTGIYLEKYEKQKNSFFFTDKEPFLATIYPVKGTLSFMGVVSEAKIKEIHVFRYIKNFVKLFLFLVFIGGGLTYLFLFLFTKPLKRLFTCMQKVQGGDLSTRFTKDKWGFEINLLGEYFNDMMQAIVTHQEEAARQSLQRKLLERELFLAHEIQKGLLPHFSSKLPIQVATFFSPSFHMGGDFYDLFELEKGKTLFYIADISGKGLEAGLYALTLRSYMRGASKGKKELKDLLYSVNELFLQDTEKASVFATCWVGIYEEKAELLTYASLGHPPAYLIRKEKVEELITHNLALGVQKESFIVKTEKIQKKDMLFFFTDGLFEAEKEKGDFYSLSRLKTYLFSQRGKSPKELIKNLQKEIEEYQKEKRDDVAAMALYFE